MSELKLTVEQLKNYLGTGLKFNAMGCHVDEYSEPKIDAEFEMIGISPDWVEGDSLYLQKDFMIVDILPYFYRLSDLDKFIPELGFVPAEKLFYGAWMMIFKEFIKNNNQLDRISYNDIQKLFQWNFWPFGDEYFEEGLIIDKLNIQTK